MRLIPSLSFTSGLVVALAMTSAAPVLGAAHNSDAMAGHMEMTPSRAQQPGDKQRAATIVAAARKAADP